MKALRHYLLIASAIFLSSCQSTSIYIDVLKPATLELDAQYSKISVVNRSLPDQNNRSRSRYEALSSGENRKHDMRASEQSVIFLTEIINETPRFSAIAADSIILLGTGLKLWPLPLDQATIRSIASQNNADIVIVLETFDTDIIKYAEYDDEQNLRNKGSDIFIHAGWRMYDVKTGAVVDEYLVTDVIRSDKTQPVFNRKKKYAFASMSGGHAAYMYATRITPTWQAEQRIILKTTNGNMMKAARLASQNKWDESLALWHIMKNSDNPKVKGYSLHNIALYNEVKGQTESALALAREAYTAYPNHITAHYINILEKRLKEKDVLKRQLGG
jgi:hypothetical protein